MPRRGSRLVTGRASNPLAARFREIERAIRRRQGSPGPLSPGGGGGAGTGVPAPGGGGEAGGGTDLPLADSVISETTFGQSPDAGSDDNAARGDHTHGTPNNPTGGAGDCTGIPQIAALSVDKTGNTLDDITVTFAIDGPSGIVDGSLLVAQVSAYGTGSLGTPAGWTKVVETSGDALSSRTAWFTRFCDGTETSVVFTDSRNSAVVGMTAKVHRIEGHATTGFVNASSATPVDNNRVEDYDVVGVTTTVQGCLVLFGTADGAASCRAHTWSGITGLAEIDDFCSDPGTAVTQSSAQMVADNAGNTGDATANHGVSQSACSGACVAIAPNEAVCAEGYSLASFTHIAQGTTSYTLPPGINAILVECVGGGGGGGGAASAASSAAAGGGGGGGGYAQTWITAPDASYAVVVGAGGAGGAAGNNDGAAGGSTTFGSPSVCTAEGGGVGAAPGGGFGMAAGTAPLFASGQRGGLTNLGDLTLDGYFGRPGIRLSGTVACSGQGGNAPRGGSGGRDNTFVGAGWPGGGTPQGTTGEGGGGGGGATVMNGSAAAAGGNGANGFITVWEFA